MDFVEGPVKLGEWMPDMPDLQFPNLLEARNVEPVGTVYKAFSALDSTPGSVVPGGYVRGGAVAQLNSIPYYYAYTDGGIYESIGGATFNSRATAFSVPQVDFLQFDDLEIAACGGSNPTLCHTIGSVSNFATLGSTTGTAPNAQRVGRINKFVMLGNTSVDPTHVRWSGLDDPFSWPTPNSATAIAQQAGEQYMDAALGAVTGFTSGDQFGLVFQESGITRVTYVGPPVVFQFDKISDRVGSTYPRSIVQIGPIAYFIGTDGIYRTDGVTIQDVGFNKVDRYFLSRLTGARERVYGVANIYKKLIYWAFCNTSDSESLPSEILLYNYEEQRFSLASQSCEFLYGTTGLELTSAVRNVYGLGASNTLGSFSNGTLPISASTIYTGFAEINPGGFARLQGVKFLVDATAANRLAQVEYATEIDTSTSITSSVTANSATGFSDFNVEARYHSFRFSGSTNFQQLQSIELKAKPSGSR